jgi:hypothetical protein
MYRHRFKVRYHLEVITPRTNTKQSTKQTKQNKKHQLPGTMPMNAAAKRPALESYRTMLRMQMSMGRCVIYLDFRGEKVGGESRVARHPRNDEYTHFTNVNGQMQCMQNTPI